MVPLAGVGPLAAGEQLHLIDTAMPGMTRRDSLRAPQQQDRLPLGRSLIGELAQFVERVAVGRPIAVSWLAAQRESAAALHVDVLDRVSVIGVSLHALVGPPRGLFPPPPGALRRSADHIGGQDAD